VGLKDYFLNETGYLGVPCSFLRPADWKAREIGNDDYKAIFIEGPRNQAGTYTVSLVVAALLTSEPTLEKAASSLIARYRSAFDCTVLAQTDGIVARRTAVELEISFSMLLPPNEVNPQQTAIRERHIFLLQGGQIFEFTYSAPDEDYATWLEAFHILVQTFSFTEDAQKTTLFSLVGDVQPSTTTSNDEEDKGNK